MKFGPSPVIYDLNPYDSSSVQQHQLGALAFSADGRKFRYCKAVATTVTGDCYSSAGQDAQFQSMAVNAIEPIGETAIAVTNGTTVVAANDFNEGYLMISSSTGIGQMSQITSHSTGISGATITYNIADPLKVALATTSKVTVIKNPFDDIIIQATTPVAATAGVSCFAIPTGEFGWIQTGGPAACLWDNVPTTVELLSVGASTTTAGAVTITTAANTAQIGIGMQVVSVSAYVAPVFLTLD